MTVELLRLAVKSRLVARCTVKLAGLAAEAQVNVAVYLLLVSVTLTAALVGAAGSAGTRIAAAMVTKADEPPALYAATW